MKLAVKLYKDVPNAPKGIPQSWPAEVMELIDGRQFPGAPWIEMSLEEYNRYRLEHSASYADYEEKFDPKGLRKAPEAPQAPSPRRPWWKFW